MIKQQFTIVFLVKIFVVLLLEIALLVYCIGSLLCDPLVFIAAAINSLMGRNPLNRDSTSFSITMAVLETAGSTPFSFASITWLLYVLLASLSGHSSNSPYGSISESIGRLLSSSSRVRTMGLSGWFMGGGVDRSSVKTNSTLSSASSCCCFSFSFSVSVFCGVLPHH